MTIHDYEREKGMIIKGDIDPSKTINLKEFEKLKDDNGFLGVDFESREQFLKDNGYDLTRENLTKDLSAKS